MNATSRTGASLRAVGGSRTDAPSGRRGGRAIARTGGRGARRVARGAPERSTRELILEAAAAAFADRGYSGVNLADVVEELGFTKGALYFYFPNKESLAAEIVDRHVASWDPIVAESVEETDDLLDALVAVTHKVAEAFRTDPIARAGTRLSSERNLISASLPEPFVGWITGFTDLLRRAQEAGQLEESVDPKGLARMVVSYFYGAQAVSETLTRRDDLHKRLDEFWGLVLPQVRAKAPVGRARSRARAR